MTLTAHHGYEGKVAVINCFPSTYDNVTTSTTFEVVGSDFADFFDNSTSDNFSDGSSSSDSCCSSSSSSSNVDFTSPTVKSTSPSDGDSNVATVLS